MRRDTSCIFGLWLTMGMVLSLPILLAGLGLLFFAKGRARA
jgi:prolipoprotein diacylglyceryltransferase